MIETHIVKFEELSLGVKFEDVSFGVMFDAVPFSLGFVAVVDLSLGLVFRVVVCCVSSGRCSGVEVGWI